MQLFEKILLEHENDIKDRAGVVIQKKETNLILGCHAWGKNKDRRSYLDLPKGHLTDSDEDPIEGAIREVKEETGLELKTTDLRKLGKYRYGKYYIYLYFAEVDFELDDLHCDCLFTNIWGKEVPEMIGFELVDLDERISPPFYKSLKPILERVKQELHD